MKLHLNFTCHELSIENDQAGVVKNDQLSLGVDLMCAAQYEARLKAINGEYVPAVWLSTLKENQKTANKMLLNIRESGRNILRPPIEIVVEHKERLKNLLLKIPRDVDAVAENVHLMPFLYNKAHNE
ncbi:hypothetical protein ACTXT7_011599 [Hymenolepis weldensis]